MKVFDPTDAFRVLNGIFCVYKPANESLEVICKSIAKKLCQEVNQLEIKPGGTTEKRVATLLQSSSKDAASVTTSGYFLHPLVTGGLFQPEDFEIQPLQSMSEESSGVCPLAINDGLDLIKKFQAARHMKLYELKGRVGRSTLDHSECGKIIEKSSFRHISQYKIDKVLSKLTYAGVHLQSQQAYELASKGALRPAEDSTPIMYGLRCQNYTPPYFTLELQCINEDDWYLKTFIHEFGLLLRSGAVYTKIRKIRHGHFTLRDALLAKHWTFEHIAHNLAICGQQVSEEKLLRNPTVGQHKLGTSANVSRDYLEFYPAEMEFLPEEAEVKLLSRLTASEDTEELSTAESDVEVPLCKDPFFYQLS